MTSKNNSLRIALISDTGGPAASGTTFYYNVGSGGNGFVPTNSFGPGPQAVSRLVQSWAPSELFAIGDLAYNAGGSTVQDISIGQYYNNFIYPYPSPVYLRDPYVAINGVGAQTGKKSWPYNIYNYPSGFPSPLNGGQGGSSDQKNHFWGALGNHDYGMEVGYGQVGVTPYNFAGKSTGDPVGPSSTTSVRAAIDYFLPFLENPALLGEEQSRLNVGAVDPTGNRGAYYSISFGGTPEKPLVEFFQLDTERLNVNAGFETWNPSGMKVWNPTTRLYEDQVARDKQYSLKYDPSNSSFLALANTTNDPNNGYDQFIWLKQSLENSNATWKIITGHHPVYASGRWGDRQPDDHMSNPYLQRLLNALPEGSFDAYYNGHDHFYERVLESKAGGIGLGIPFITNGNSGRNLSKKIQVPYGVSVYEPTKWDTSKGADNPNTDALDYLLDSAPLEVAASGLAGDGDKTERSSFNNGLYGYGFGATQVELDKDYLLFRYEEVPIVDPAIANHLSGGPEPELGFAGTTAEDWIPNPTGEFSGKSDLAQFKLAITNGIVTGVELLNSGRGYMSSKGGTHRVQGFNIYGNNVDPLRPWEGTAQVDLSFVDGKLNSVSLTEGGRGYELVVQAAAENNTVTSTADLKPDQSIIVALDYNLAEIQYLVRDNTLYSDWYLIADTSILPVALKEGDFGALSVHLQPSSERARAIIGSQALTTGYSGQGPQASYVKPQRGPLTVTDAQGTTVAGGPTLQFDNGAAKLNLQRVPAPGPLQVSFGGDPTSSYLVNYKPSSTSLNLSYGSWNTGLTPDGRNTLLFTTDLPLSLSRTDTVPGRVSFGLRPGSGSVGSQLLMQNGAAASAGSLTTQRIFTPSGSGSWLTSEGKSLGSSAAGNNLISAGRWIPFALDSDGRQLDATAVNVSGNVAVVDFAGGYQAHYTTPGSGKAINTMVPGPLVLSVQRLGSAANGLALYEADPITGEITTAEGRRLLPGESGYLQAALANAKASDLLISADQVPAYKSEKIYSNLPLSSAKNYGLLLLRGGDSDNIVSSYSAANPGAQVEIQSFAAPQRGIVWGVEDRPIDNPWRDNDFNDLIVSLRAADFTII